MRRVRHRIVVAVGVLFLAGTTAAVEAQPQTAKRGQQAKAKTERSTPTPVARPVHRNRAQAAKSSKPQASGRDHRQASNRHQRQAQPVRPQPRTSARAVQYRLVRIAGRVVREPVDDFLPGFRVPQRRREALAPRRAAAPAQAKRVRQVQHTRTSRQAVSTQQGRATHRASLAKPEPSRFSKYRPTALVSEARRYLGTNPTKMARRWCARFMNFVLDRVGLPGTGSDAAKSFAMYGRRISGPQYGAIAVLSRQGGGHVGIVTGIDRNGNPILIAGNNGRRQVGISVYAKRRVIAYVMPDGREPVNTRLASAKPGKTGAR